MDESRQKEKHSNILWLLLGTFLIPTINGVEGLLNGLLKWVGLTISYKLIASITFNLIVIICLIYLIVLILKNGTARYSNIFEFSFDKFKLYGLVFIFIIIVSRVTNFYMVTNHTKEMDLLEANGRYDLLIDSSYLFLTSVILTTTRDAFLFLVFFIVLFKKGD
jgi:hypothetical protein